MFCQLIVYVVCINLAGDSEHRLSEIKYWMEYLCSLIPINSEDPIAREKWKIIVVGVRADESREDFPPTAIPTWQATWPNLPIHSNIMITSQKDPKLCTIY